ncbi:hypothetical protein, conserved [Leishmania tarentolae]|uniref:Uncharacterized protein n=1 Tax=Leishmania tarentolae TaxID=5689 RepID=A0A640KWC3_LEITA|nr:hypothetical protein, conserved [Leishmania tarentolae]
MSYTLPNIREMATRLRRVSATQQLRVRWMLTTGATCCLSTATNVSWNQRRTCTFFATAPQPPSMPLASPPPLHDMTAAETLKTTREEFAAVLARAEAEVADALPRRGSCAAQFARSDHLSAWTEYLVGLRDMPPRSTGEAPHESSRASMKTSSSIARSPLTNDSAAEQGMFLQHIFDDAKEAALYWTTRQPESFLRPEQATADAASEGSFQWQLMPLSAALKDMEAVLQDMLMREQEGCAKGNLVAPPTHSVITFWRSMLEQAFLVQYCELAALADGDATALGAPPHWLHHLYPYDYSRQPARLRRRLERGIRALLCSSAYTLHMHWEQHMTRHSPSDDAAKILGLEFVLLWWWANPDQMPIEISVVATRLPPPTLQSLRQRELSAEVAALGRHGDGRQPAALPRRAVDIPMTSPSVEQHLQQYLAHHFGLGSVDVHTPLQPERQLQQQRRRHAVHRDGGFLSPAAVFPPAYQDALRAHLYRVRHRKNLSTCPLFLRLLEVALTVATSDAAASDAGSVPSFSTHAAQRKPLSAAARRGREIAIQLCQGWLWPVVCGRASPPTIPSSRQSLRRSSTCVAQAPPHTESMETFEDWGVLIAAVAAVSQVRGSLLALRRANEASVRGRPEEAQCTPISGVGRGSTKDPAAVTLERGMNLAHIRDRLYMPLMRFLLADPADMLSSDCECFAEAYDGTVPDDMPGWVALVFARVSACFEEAGMLQRDLARQPATPARLWCLLFNAMCDAFPNVFHARNTVTVMWTLLTLEGVCSGPSLYYSTYRATNAGKTQTMSAWLNTLAAWNNSRGLSAELAQLETLLRGADESEALVAGAFCPRTERCQRTAFVLSAAIVETSANNSGAGHSGVGASSTHARQGRRNCRLPSLPSFASTLSPALPLQLSSAAEIAQARAHIASCAEICQEVATMSIDIFRRYATLSASVLGVESLPYTEPPVSVAHEGETRHWRTDGRLPTEATYLRPRGHPSLMVLLRLLQVVALFGDAGNPASVGDPGLLQSVIDDVLRACHPVVSVHLRKLRVYAAAVSGRSGALALLHNQAYQCALDSLPPALGRQRLVKALLWSGLPVSALEKGKETEAAVYGSGSLAWHVLERNQQRFLAFHLHNTAAAASVDMSDSERYKSQLFSTHEGSETSSGADNDTNSFTYVVSCLDEVLRHLWQLAIAIPDTARLPLYLYPFMNNGMRGHNDPDATVNYREAVVSRSDEGTPVPTSCDSGEASYNESDSARVSSDEDTSQALLTAAAAEELPDGLEYDSGGLLETTVNECLDAEVEGGDTPADWDTNSLYVEADFDDDVAAVVPLAEDAHAPLTAASLWDSGAAVRASLTRTTVEREDANMTATDSHEGSGLKQEESTENADACNTSIHQDNYRALAQALLLATPAAQHIFYSLLEVLSWTATPQTYLTDFTTSWALVCPLGHAQLPDGMGRHWCARLAASYDKCVSVWETHCRLTSASRADTPGAAVLCRPQTMERIALLLLQSCPDVYALSLLLLAITGVTADAQYLSPSAVEAFARRVRRTGSLLPWSVESSLSQLLFHAGVTAASVRRWRAARGLTDGPVPPWGRRVVASAALLHVEDHRKLLQRVHETRHTVDACGGTSDADYKVKRDLLLSMGSLLLCSLELRSAAGYRPRVLYRYNVYVNEFLLHRMPATEAKSLAPSSSSSDTSITTLRVILPSAQIMSPSPSSMPPQQVASLKVAWLRRMGRSEKATVRSCFPTRHAPSTPPTDKEPHCSNSPFTENGCEEHNEDYQTAFL